ncbi:MAG: uracil-DNA glycosylase [Holophagales bacterium]|nr:uracil-DNA glycosylase [Holophagales bacterium]MYC09752.1 uracil-DNA glycosylase [Holophagales bacterium]
MNRTRLPITREIDLLRDLGFTDAYPPPAAPAAPAARSASVAIGGRLERLRVVAEEAQGCTACGLCRARNKVVFGDGDGAADLMFVGEGPGAQEDRQGLPFVGPAGQLLTRIIQAIDLRREDVYITNVVKCRPPNNRDPQPDETAACRSFLDRQVDLIAPRVIVALGRVAAQQLLGTTNSLGRLRGTWHEARGVPVRVTYHPAFLLRDPSYKRATWEDMQVVRDRLLGADGAE